jgi:hypothetical protein
MSFIQGDSNLDGNDSTVPSTGPAPLGPASTYMNIGGATVTVQNVLKVGVGASGSFTTPTGQIVTVQNGIITNIF